MVYIRILLRLRPELAPQTLTAADCTAVPMSADNPRKSTVIRVRVSGLLAGGLIGSPEPGTKGATVCTALLQPGLVPGAPVQLQSEYVSGTFRIERVSCSGDTSGRAWYADLEVRESAT